MAEQFPPPPPLGSDRSNPIYSVRGSSDKSLMVDTILSALFFVCGVSGLHRFYAGKIGTGLLMLFTFGGLGIWAVVDLIVLVTGNFRDRDDNRITNWNLS
jgi:TM2 domain-containing membrane protein YozV